MDNEIQLISDGDGIAVIGEPAAVERFLTGEGLPSKDLGLPRLGTVLSAGSAAAQAGAQLADHSGRWVQLTKESAKLAELHGGLAKNASGLRTGVVRASNGQIKGIVQFTSGSVLGNPALLAGAAGIMAQVAMQQTMSEITDYLATIDEKVDDILRAQKDTVLADMIGVELLVDEAMTVREHVGRVSDVTWSKVQATAMTIARTQGYALLQIDALTEKVARKGGVGDLAAASEGAAASLHEWLAVLARCFQLQDAIAVLELDRVLDADPEELDRHRIALRTARRRRMDLIARSTLHLMSRLDAAAGTANDKVLLNPIQAPVIVRSSNEVATAVLDLHRRLGIESDRDDVTARPWLDAAGEVRDKARAAGADGIGAAKRHGSAALGRVRSVKRKLPDDLSGRVHRSRDDAED